VASCRRVNEASKATLDPTTISLPVIAINGEVDAPAVKTMWMWRELRQFQHVVLSGNIHVNPVAVGGIDAEAGRGGDGGIPRSTRRIIGIYSSQGESRHPLLGIGSARSLFACMTSKPPDKLFDGALRTPILVTG
jgi:hypothetical protein